MSKFVDGVYSTPLSGMRAFREEGCIIIEAGCAGYFCEIDCEGNDDAESDAVHIVDALTAQMTLRHEDAEDLRERFEHIWAAGYPHPDKETVIDALKNMRTENGYLTQSAHSPLGDVAVAWQWFKKGRESLK